MIEETAIYNDLLAIFAEILPANEYQPGKNYETNIGSLVVDRRIFSIDPDEVEVFYLEDPEINYDEKQEFSADHQAVHTFTAKAFFAKTNDTLEYLRAVSRDLRRAIGKNYSMLQTKYPDIIIRPVTIVKGFEKREKTRGGIVFRFTVHLSQEPWLINEPEY